MGKKYEESGSPSAKSDRGTQHHQTQTSFEEELGKIKLEMCTGQGKERSQHGLWQETLQAVLRREMITKKTVGEKKTKKSSPC